MKKYAIAIITVLLLTFSNCPDIQAKYLVNHAKAGKNATWSLDTEGNMTVEGKGIVDMGGNLYFQYCNKVKKIILKKELLVLNRYQVAIRQTRLCFQTHWFQ